MLSNYGSCRGHCASTNDSLNVYNFIVKVQTVTCFILTVQSGSHVGCGVLPELPDLRRTAEVYVIQLFTVRISVENHAGRSGTVRKAGSGSYTL